MRHVEIREALTFNGEPKAWFVTVNGVQVGGSIDRSGAGNLTFPSRAEAMAWIKETLKARA